MSTHRKHSNQSSPATLHSAILDLSDKMKANLSVIQVRFFCFCFQKIPLNLNFKSSQQGSSATHKIMDVINLLQILSGQYVIFFLRSSKNFHNFSH